MKKDSYWKTEEDKVSKTWKVEFKKKWIGVFVFLAVLAFGGLGGGIWGLVSNLQEAEKWKPGVMILGFFIFAGMLAAMWNLFIKIRKDKKETIKKLKEEGKEIYTKAGEKKGTN